MDISTLIIFGVVYGILSAFVAMWMIEYHSEVPGYVFVTVIILWGILVPIYFLRAVIMAFIYMGKRLW